RLSTRPLADMLYHDRSIERSAFVCRRLAAPVPFHATARRAQPGAAGALWARRSAFWRNGQPLLVAECFLPAFWRDVERQPACPRRGPARTRRRSTPAIGLQRDLPRRRRHEGG